MGEEVRGGGGGGGRHEEENNNDDEWGAAAAAAGKEREKGSAGVEGRKGVEGSTFSPCKLGWFDFILSYPRWFTFISTANIRLC